MSAATAEVTEFSGDEQLTGKSAVFGRLDIRTASLDTGIGHRDRHLRSADFFEIERFEEINVVVTAVHPSEGRSGDLRVNFTIKGITALLPLPAEITELDDGSIRIEAKTQVNRTQFDLDWNKFGMIGPTATAAANLVFTRSPG